MSYDSRSPLYMQVQQYIQNQIEHGELKPNDRIPTEKELMDQFQVSRITVVNALASLAKEGIIYRVPGRGSFVSEAPPTDSAPNQEIKTVLEASPSVKDTPAPNVARRIERTIGFVMPTLNDYFEVRIINAIKRTLKERGYNMLLAYSDGDKEREEQQIRQFMDIGVAGLLLFPVDEDLYNEEILSLKVNQFPFVLIDRYLPGVETHYVCSDNRMGAKMAVQHLMELGHRKIAICTDAYRGTMSVQDRIHGYMDAFQQSGELIDPALILTDFTVPNEPEAMMNSELARYMKSEMATAYIALNGQLGIYLKMIAERHGFRVPEDISIVSFDDPGSPNGHNGYFTHIDQNEAEIGRLAASTLADLLEKPAGNSRDGRYEKIMIAPKLRIRQSTTSVSQ
ncbi:GntR family transcriptional regulator [Paenibacillus marinisediminis]